MNRPFGWRMRRLWDRPRGTGYSRTMAEAPHERRPRTPMPRDGVQPAPDGRGAPEPRPRGRMPRMPGSRGFWVLVLVLLVVNYVSVALFAPGKERSVKVPYSPTFLQQV